MSNIRETKIYMDAAEYAKKMHQGQIYYAYGNEPGSYYKHVQDVADLLIENFKDDENVNFESLVLQGLLHDTIEDTTATYDDIFKLFGKNVADGVLALSKNEKLPKEKQMEDSLSRILKQPKETAIVKMADRACNISSVKATWDYNRLIKYAAEAEIILNTLQKTDAKMAGVLKEKIKNYKKIAEQHKKV